MPGYTLKKGESLVLRIGEGMEAKVTNVGESNARLSVSAPRYVEINRGAVDARKQAEKQPQAKEA